MTVEERLTALEAMTDDLVLMLKGFVGTVPRVKADNRIADRAARLMEALEPQAPQPERTMTWRP